MRECRNLMKGEINESELNNSYSYLSKRIKEVQSMKNTPNIPCKRIGKIVKPFSYSMHVSLQERQSSLRAHSKQIFPRIHNSTNKVHHSDIKKKQKITRLGKNSPCNSFLFVLNEAAEGRSSMKNLCHSPQQTSQEELRKQNMLYKNEDREEGAKNMPEEKVEREEVTRNNSPENGRKELTRNNTAQSNQEKVSRPNSRENLKGMQKEGKRVTKQGVMKEEMIKAIQEEVIKEVRKVMKEEMKKMNEEKETKKMNKIEVKNKVNKEVNKEVKNKVNKEVKNKATKEEGNNMVNKEEEKNKQNLAQQGGECNQLSSQIQQIVAKLLDPNIKQGCKDHTKKENTKQRQTHAHPTHKGKELKELGVNSVSKGSHQVSPKKPKKQSPEKKAPKNNTIKQKKGAEALGKGSNSKQVPKKPHLVFKSHPFMDKKGNAGKPSNKEHNVQNKEGGNQGQESLGSNMPVVRKNKVRDQFSF